MSLAVLAVASTPKWTKVFTRHLNTVLLAFFGVYAYRDLFPFATFHGVPADKAEGPVLWAKLAIIFFSAIVIPLAIPGLYVPVDPKVSNFAMFRVSSGSKMQDRMAVPNPEQTASLFSFVTFSFLDPLVKLANRLPALTAGHLPPLSDYDRAKFLKARAFPVCFIPL